MDRAVHAQFLQGDKESPSRQRYMEDMPKQHTIVLRRTFSVTRRYTATQTKDLRPATRASKTALQ